MKRKAFKDYARECVMKRIRDEIRLYDIYAAWVDLFFRGVTDSMPCFNDDPAYQIFQRMGVIE